MFKKILHTNYYSSKPILVWDGDCTFCKFWKTRWELKTKQKIKYATYQEVSNCFKDIPLKEFKKSSKLIETNGNVYNGPDSAYRSLFVAGNKKWHQLYHYSSLFQKISDHAYNHIAKNRSFYYKVTILCFGKNPKSIKAYWLVYVFAFIVIITFIFYFIS